MNQIVVKAKVPQVSTRSQITASAEKRICSRPMADRKRTATDRTPTQVSPRRKIRVRQRHRTLETSSRSLLFAIRLSESFMFHSFCIPCPS